MQVSEPCLPPNYPLRAPGIAFARSTTNMSTPAAFAVYGRICGR